MIVDPTEMDDAMMAGGGMPSTARRAGLQDPSRSANTAENIVASLLKFLSADTSAEDREEEHQNLIRIQGSVGIYLRVLRISSDCKVPTVKFSKREAWDICYQILDSPRLYPTEATVFAAQTLKMKTRKDLNQISEEQLVRLRESLIRFLGAHTSGRAVVSQLSLSLTNIAVVMNTWENPIKQILSIYGAQQQMTPTLLEFLSVICEELTYGNRSDLDYDELDRRSDEILKGASQIVYDLFCRTINSEHRVSVLECLSIWIESGDISASKIINGALIEPLLQCLCDDDSVSVASDCLSKMFIKSYGYEDSSMANVARLRSALWAIRNILTANKDTHNLVCLCKIYVAAGESWITLIVGKCVEYAEIVQTILEFSTSVDYEIVQLSFNFWYCLIRELTIPGAGHEVRKAYAPTIGMLISVMTGHLCFPDNFDSLCDEDRDNFLDFRHEVCFVLEDCMEVIEDEVALSLPYKSLQENLLALQPSQDYSHVAIGSEPKLLKIEAAVHCIRVMGNVIKSKDIPIVSDIMATVFNLPNHPLVKRSLIMLTATYAGWIAAHPEFIPYTIQLIIDGYSIKECIKASTLSLKCICKECPQHVVPFLDLLYPLYTKNIQTLPSAVGEDLADAMARVISSVPPDKLYHYSAIFTSPIIECIGHFARAISMGESSESAPSLKGMEKNLKIISTFLKRVNSDLLSSEIVGYWQVIANAVEISAANEPVAEAAVCTLTNIVKYHRAASDFIISNLISCIYTQFASRKYGCWMYAAKWIIREHGQSQNAQRVQDVFKMVADMSYMFLDMFSGSYKTPEVIRYEIEDFFIMSHEAVKCMPLLYFRLELLPLVIEAAIQSLPISSRASIVAVLKFLKAFFEYSPGQDLPQEDLLVAGYCAKIPFTVLNGTENPLLNPAGLPNMRFFEGLIHTLLNNLLTIYPRDRETAGAISNLIQVLADVLSPAAVYSPIEDYVRKKVTSQASESTKNEFLLEFKCTLESNTKGALSPLLRDFASTFRRSHSRRSKAS